MELFSDAGSIPAISTKRVLDEHLFLLRRLRSKGFDLIQEEMSSQIIRGDIFLFSINAMSSFIHTFDILQSPLYNQSIKAKEACQCARNTMFI